MSRKLIVVFVCTLCLVGSAAKANILTNGDFSNGLTGWWTWTPNSAAQSVTVAGGVATIVNADTTGAGDAHLGQNPSTSSGAVLTLSFYFKATDVAGGGYAGEGAGLEFYDASNNWISEGVWENLWDTTSYTSNWVPITLTAVAAPSNVSYVQVLFDLWAGGGGSSTMLVEGANLTPEPATMVLLGLGGLLAIRRKHA